MYHLTESVWVEYRCDCAKDPTSSWYVVGSLVVPRGVESPWLYLTERTYTWVFTSWLLGVTASSPFVFSWPAVSPEMVVMHFWYCMTMNSWQKTWSYSILQWPGGKKSLVSALWHDQFGALLISTEKEKGKEAVQNINAITLIGAQHCFCKNHY